GVGWLPGVDGQGLETVVRLVAHRARVRDPARGGGRMFGSGRTPAGRPRGVVSPPPRTVERWRRGGWFRDGPAAARHATEFPTAQPDRAAWRPDAWKPCSS